ncbi:MAG: S8 family peptidase [Blastocatellia bacterium]
MKRLPALVIVIAVGTLLLPFLMVQGQEQTQTGGIRRVARPIPGQYIVKLKDDAASPDEKSDQSQDQNNDQNQDRKLEALAADLSRLHGGGVKHIYTSALKGFSTSMSEAEALALSRDPRVAYVEEDGEVWGAACSQSTQPSAPWNLDRIDQAALPLSGTYTYTFHGDGVNVYVIDSGLRTTHWEFSGRAANVFDRDGGTGDDCSGHGTHVAGIIGGRAHGVAKHVKLYGVRVLGCDNRGSNSDVIRGVDWVTQNHKKPAIANMSLSGGMSSAVDDAVNRSIAAGVTYVVAAGNGTDNDGVAVDAGKFSPGRVEKAITVGATDSAARRCRPVE